MRGISRLTILDTIYSRSGVPPSMVRCVSIDIPGMVLHELLLKFMPFSAVHDMADIISFAHFEFLYVPRASSQSKISLAVKLKNIYISAEQNVNEFCRFLKLQFHL